MGDAVRRRCLVRAALGASPYERILDVGCGPGFYCAELVDEVGPAGRSSASTAGRRCWSWLHAAARGTTTRRPMGDEPRPWWDKALDPLRHEESMFRVLLVVIAIAAVIVLVI